jgi:hypothetical protein
MKTLTDEQLEKLDAALDEALSPHGVGEHFAWYCDHTLAGTRAALTDLGLSGDQVEAAVAEFVGLDGTCDCLVMWNVLRPTAVGQTQTVDEAYYRHAARKEAEKLGDPRGRSVLKLLDLAWNGATDEERRRFLRQRADAIVRLLGMPSA